MARTVPKKRAVEIHDVEENGDMIVHDADGGQLLVLNPVGAAIFDLIDGERDLDGIVDVLVATVEVSRDEARRDVEAFVQDLASRGIIAFG